ncbi:OmpA family protein [Helicobacter mehlei]|uniref:OmpA family protein n=1 Tax=Helicobacter mehlei TaxID=2316080 RepID=A0A553V3F0_9HELI|nr:OmpA family protein [Helicobacter mehlei]TSA86970.1 OmpA family protein [Helicobacter mehlei]
MNATMKGVLLLGLLVVGCAGRHVPPATLPPEQPTPAPQPAFKQDQTMQKEQVQPQPTPAPQPAPQPQPEPQPAPTPEPPKATFPSGTIIGEIYFDFDKYSVRTDMQDVIDESVQKIKDSHMKVLLEGNTDEFGTGEYNFALGLKRALSVKRALIVKGIPKETIKIVSYGETKPACQEKVKECYRKNRRVNIKVVD